MFWIFFGWYILGLCVGALVAIVVSIRKHQKKNVGTIRLDHSDPDRPYLFLELDKGGLEQLKNSNWVVLDVNLQNYISQ